MEKITQLITRDIMSEIPIHNNEYCETMRRVVRELSVHHEIPFKGMMTKLSSYQTVESISIMFDALSTELFNDDKINWGRVVVLFALTKQLSQNCSNHDQLATKISDIVNNKLGSWISKNDGWNGFLGFFKQDFV